MTHKIVGYTHVGLLIIALILGLTIRPVTAQADATQTALTTQQIRNLFLQADGLGGGIQLVDGVAEEYAADGELLATYEVMNPIALGDLNGDGHGDGAMVLQVVPMSGDSVIYSVHAILNIDGVAERVAFAILSENGRILNFAIRDEQIVVDMITRGPKDAECCASTPVRQIYQLQSNGAFDLIKEQSFTEAKLPFAFDDELTWDELANLTYPETFDYSALDLVDGQYSYISGDNTFGYQLLDNVVYGDLTGDGLAEAIVFVEYSFNGEPAIQHMYVVMNDRGMPFIVGWQDYSRVGDVEITSVTIADQILTVEFIDIVHDNALSSSMVIEEEALVILEAMD